MNEIIKTKFVTKFNHYAYHCFVSLFSFLNRCEWIKYVQWHPCGKWYSKCFWLKYWNGLRHRKNRQSTWNGNLFHVTGCSYRYSAGSDLIQSRPASHFVSINLVVFSQWSFRFQEKKNVLDITMVKSDWRLKRCKAHNNYPFALSWDGSGSSCSMYKKKTENAVQLQNGFS